MEKREQLVEPKKAYIKIRKEIPMKNSKRSLIYGIILMLLSSICTCSGQLMWKMASVEDNKIVYYMFGFALYGIGAIVMIIAFNFGD